MRLVVDTNVVISALLKPGSVPDLALDAIRARGAVVLHDARIAAEYREVTARRKFRAIPRERVAAMLDRLLEGPPSADVAPWDGSMTDESDRAFVEVALAGEADAIVTGNARHFPTALSFEVVSPAALLARIG